MNQQKQTILITGASSGLGHQMARTLLEKGFTVIATMRQISGKNAATAASLLDYSQNQPGALHLVEMDVADEASVQSAIATVLAHVQHIDVVINNAGIGGGGLTEAFSVEQLRQTLDVNVLGIQRVMRAVLPPMRSRKSGLIINVSSAMGRMVVPFAGPYTASKYAVEGLSESYRYELVNTGVDVVIVEPGGFMTNYWTSMMNPADSDRTQGYGSAADMPDALWKGIPTMLSSAEVANPAVFAEAIVELIATPAGQRPVRLVVDPVTGGGGPQAINDVSEQVQRQVLEAFGLNDLLAALPAQGG